MALHVLRAGYELVTLDRPSAGSAALVAAGARIAPTPRALAHQCDAAVTMLPSDEVVRSVVLGDDGVRSGLAAGGLFIDMSSSAPSTAREIAAAFDATGCDAVDAPVSGGEAGAIAATLAIMAGGSERAFRRATPLFAHLGTTVVRIGDAGAGQVAKVCNQIVVAITIEAVAEALALAEAAGVDVAAVRTAMRGGLADSTILDRYGARMLASDYTPGARARLHLKDLINACDVAQSAGLILPGLALMREQYETLVERDGDLDHSAIRLLFTGKA